MARIGALEIGYLKKDWPARIRALRRSRKYFGLNEKAIRYPLPAIETAADCAKAQACITQAVAAGTILPSEAETLAGLIEQQRRDLETSDLVGRMHELERILKGGRETMSTSLLRRLARLEAVLKPTPEQGFTILIEPGFEAPGTEWQAHRQGDRRGLVAR